MAAGSSIPTESRAPRLDHAVVELGDPPARDVVHGGTHLGSVRDVHEVLNAERETGYTTVLKFLQIMTEKGLVARDTSRRPYVFTAQLPREATQSQLLNDLVERAFDSSASQLVMRALSDARATPQEIAAMRKMLDELEDKDA